MSERAAIAGVEEAGVSATPGAQFLHPIFCFRCGVDVAALPADARFCSRCGAHLPRRFQSTSVSAAAGPQYPLILVAYARALFNLGCRYQDAIGSRRNPEEAARCFAKAARLGHVAANGPREAKMSLETLPPGPPLADLHHPTAV